MERDRRRKLKVRDITEGNRQILKQKNVPKLASESSSCSRDTLEEDLFLFDLWRSSSKGDAGTSMKKLAAEEMSKETEAKRRSPSAIARLMGLDGLSPQPIHRQPRIRFQRNDQLYRGRSNMNSSMEQQEFKDVYEDLEASHVASRHYSSKCTPNSKLTKPEMAFIQHKFMDAKHHSTYELGQGSEEYIEVLDPFFVKHMCSAPSRSLCSHHIAMLKPSNAAKYEASIKGVKMVRETPRKHDVGHNWKHEDGLVGHSYSSRGAHSSLKSSKIRLEGKDETDILPTRIVVLKPDPGKKHNASKSVSSSDSSHAYPSDFRKHKEYSSVGRGMAGTWEKKDLSNDVGFSRPKSGEAREISQKFTRRMRDTLGSRLIDLSSFEIQGYTGDESSYEMSGSDSESESEVVTVNFRNSFDWNNRHKSSSSCSTESSVSREAKKRLSERWMMGCINQDVRVVGKGSTLGEMLAIPDWDMRPENLDAMTGLDGASDGFACNSINAGCDGTLGISSRDSWKYGYIRNSTRLGSPRPSSFGNAGYKTSAQREALVDGRLLIPKEGMNRGRSKAVKGNFSQKEDFASINSRSSKKNSTRLRSFPPSSFGSGSYKPSAEREPLVDGRLLMPKEGMNRGRSKAMKGNFSQKEDFSFKNSRSSNTESHSSCRGYACSTGSLPGIYSSQNQFEINPVNDGPSEEHPMIPQAPNSFISTGSVVDSVVNTEHVSIAMTSGSSDELPSKLSTLMLGNGHSSPRDQEDSNPQEPSIGPSQGGSAPLQCFGPEPDSLDSSKEADHPSPVSVLEVPPTEDVSSGSECFERVSADLHDLRMQIQHLKIESDADAVAPMLVAENEDVGQGSIIVSEGNGIVRPECWESSYLVDVLIDSGFEDTGPDNLMTIWNSPDCFLGPWVFDNLEKKYNDEATELRPDRRLLFDRINSAFLEIFRHFMDSCPWAKPIMGVGSKWQKHRIKDELHKLLEKQEKEAEEYITEKVLNREMKWSDSRDEVYLIGKEIEKLLIKDLITELVTMWSF